MALSCTSRSIPNKHRHGFNRMSSYTSSRSIAMGSLSLWAVLLAGHSSFTPHLKRKAVRVPARSRQRIVMAKFLEHPTPLSTSVQHLLPTSCAKPSGSRRCLKHSNSLASASLDLEPARKLGNKHPTWPRNVFTRAVARSTQIPRRSATTTPVHLSSTKGRKVIGSMSSQLHGTTSLQVKLDNY